MRKNYLLLLLMLLQLSIGISQPKKLSFEHLNIRNGLPNDYVAQIIQDEKGYIWLNTGNSVSRYDGYKFQAYKVDVKQNVNDFFSTIFFDRNKRLWAANSHGNLFRFDAARDTLLAERNGYSDAENINFYKFFNDRQNKIWALGVD